MNAVVLFLAGRPEVRVGPFDGTNCLQLFQLFNILFSSFPCFSTFCLIILLKSSLFQLHHGYGFQ